MRRRRERTGRIARFALAAFAAASYMHPSCASVDAYERGGNKHLRSLEAAKQKYESASMLYQELRFAEGARIMYGEVDRLREFIVSNYVDKEARTMTHDDMHEEEGNEDTLSIQELRLYGTGHAEAHVRSVLLAVEGESELNNLTPAIRLLEKHCPFVEMMFHFRALYAGQCYSKLLKLYGDANDFGAYDLLLEYIESKHAMVEECEREPNRPRCAPEFVDAYVYDGLRKTSLSITASKLKLVVRSYFEASGRKRKEIVRRARKIPDRFREENPVSSRPIGSFPRGRRLRIEDADARDLVDHTLGILRRVRGILVGTHAERGLTTESSASGKSTTTDRSEAAIEFLNSERTNLIRILVRFRKQVLETDTSKRTSGKMEYQSAEMKAMKRQVMHRLSIVDIMIQTLRREDLVARIVLSSSVRSEDDNSGEDTLNGDGPVSEGSDDANIWRTMGGVGLIVAGVAIVAVSQRWTDVLMNLASRILVAFAAYRAKRRKRKRKLSKSHKHVVRTRTVERRPSKTERQISKSGAAQEHLNKLTPAPTARVPVAITNVTSIATTASDGSLVSVRKLCPQKDSTPLVRGDGKKSRSKREVSTTNAYTRFEKDSDDSTVLTPKVVVLPPTTLVHDDVTRRESTKGSGTPSPTIKSAKPKKRTRPARLVLPARPHVMERGNDVATASAIRSSRKSSEYFACEFTASTLNDSSKKDPPSKIRVELPQKTTRSFAEVVGQSESRQKKNRVRGLLLALQPIRRRSDDKTTPLVLPRSLICMVPTAEKADNRGSCEWQIRVKLPRDMTCLRYRYALVVSDDKNGNIVKDSVDTLRIRWEVVPNRRLDVRSESKRLKAPLKFFFNAGSLEFQRSVSTVPLDLCNEATGKSGVMTITSWQDANTGGQKLRATSKEFVPSRTPSPAPTGLPIGSFFEDGSFDCGPYSPDTPYPLWLPFASVPDQDSPPPASSGSS